MRILGIDPGLGITGYGVIEVEGNKIKLVEAGIIRTPFNKKIELRLNTIYSQLRNIVEEYKPKFCILEELYSHYKHPTTSILMAHARGIICLLCSQKRINLLGYPAKTIKKAIVGNGNASKYQLQRMVQNILGLNKLPEPPDVSDALALGIGHVYMTSSKITKL